MDATSTVVTSADLRAVVDQLLPLVATVPDDALERPAHGLDWTCRETMAHLADDFLAYAMQLSGAHPPVDRYVDFVNSPGREGGPSLYTEPTPAGGTATILEALDATAGLLVAVTATAPPEHRGWHPAGTADASGFAAMGIVECVLHAHDVLTALEIPYAADSQICARVLDRLFPHVERTDDGWQDLLRAGGRTDETRGKPWRWYSEVR